MSTAENRRLVERWYQALAAGDFETIFDLHHDDVVYNMVGNTPVSGRIYGKEACCHGMIAEKLLQKLVPDQIRFAKEWTIVAAEGDRVVGIMKGGGPTKDGKRYDQTYCEIFTIRDGKITEMHNFFDTVLVEECLFGNSLQSPEAPLGEPFQLS
ncbi:MAG: nuclear transport factor 2 family protein [Pseudomonadales bacterium]